jgi:hypothetical protein
MENLSAIEPGNNDFDDNSLNEISYEDLNQFWINSGFRLRSRGLS